MRIMNNISAMNAHRLYTANNSKLSKSLEKLSSGYAINRAGDNAAGLAVSEKMRAQIAGLEQASKNAQDGISMVQTYEGALTETDSILQRMRSLAVQSANGNYDNSVDRVAIEQEFKQLNDELDQIADTDFNGVIVLNGGVMADGLKVENNVFDYNNKAGQVDAANAQALADAQAAADEKIAAAQEAFDAAQAAFDAIGPKDLSNNGTAAQWNTVDNNKYDKKDAAAVFGYKDATGAWQKGGIVDAKGKSLAELGVESVSVTFKASVASDGTVTWTADSAEAVDADGNDVNFNSDSLTKLTATATDENSNTGAGGFVVSGADKDGNTVETSVNAIFEAKDVKEGDTVTLVFTNATNASYAPNNIGMDADSLENTSNLEKPTVKLAAGVKDSEMTQELADMLTKLDAAEVSFTLDENGVIASISDDTFTIAESDTVGKYNITYKDAQGKDVLIATVEDVKGKVSTGKLATTAVGTALAGASTNLNTSAYDVNDVIDTLTYDGENWINSNGEKVDLTQTGVSFGDIALTTSFTTEFEALDATGEPLKGDTIEISVKAKDAAAGQLQATYKQNTPLETTVTSIELGAASTDTETVVATWNAEFNNGAGRWEDEDGNAFNFGTNQIGGQNLGTALADITNSATAAIKNGDQIVFRATKDSKTVEIDVVTAENNNTKVSFGIAVDSFKYDIGGGLTVQAGKDDNIDSDGQNALYEALKSAEQALADAKAERPESVDDLPSDLKVSVSNAYNQATGKLSYADGMTLQVGARSKDLVDFTFEYDAEAIGDLEADLNCTSTGLGTKGLSLATQESANAAIDKIDHAINKISMVRGTFGAIQNRLEHKISNLDTNNENLTAAESRIRDTDMAAEMMEFTKNQILSQASQSMLAQANQLPQGVLSLLQ